MPKKLVIVTTCRNALPNYEALCASIDSQDDERWTHVVVDDASDEGLGIPVGETATRVVYANAERRWALRNIVEVARRYQDDPDVVIGTVDGDDELCDSRAVGFVLDAYDSDPDVDVVWTAHKWDIRPDINVSGPMPDVVDPYEFGWRTSHFRTFKASLLKSISDANFLDAKGEWFRRGYDQSLMLPVLKVGRKRRYIDTPCYLYKMDSCSIPLSQRPGSEVEQIHNIAFIRARGFLK